MIFPSYQIFNVAFLDNFGFIVGNRQNMGIVSAINNFFADGFDFSEFFARLGNIAWQEYVLFITLIFAVLLFISSLITVISKRKLFPRILAFGLAASALFFMTIRLRMIIDNSAWAFFIFLSIILFTCVFTFVMKATKSNFKSQLNSKKTKTKNKKDEKNASSPYRQGAPIFKNANPYANYGQRREDVVVLDNPCDINDGQPAYQRIDPQQQQAGYQYPYYNPYGSYYNPYGAYYQQYQQQQQYYQQYQQQYQQNPHNK
jgi:Ca2+/Na+ antiporter